MQFAVAWIAALIVLSAVCLADDAALESAGGSVSLMKGHPSIRMVEESVRVKLPECQVEAAFVFRNEGASTTVLIGFPEEGEDCVRLKGFKSLVDGAPITARRIMQTKPTEDSDAYEAWWVKRIPFAKGQMRTIVNRYTGGRLITGYGCTGFKYILKTGASWRGRIGRARVICDIAALRNCAPIRFTPAGATRTANSIVWDLRDFKPKKDIWVQWFDGFAEVRVHGKPVVKFSRDEKLPYWPSYDMDMRPQRKRQEVWVGTKTAQDWLAAPRKVTDRDRSFRFSRSTRWIELRKGHRMALTDRGKIRLPRAIYVDHDCAMVPLTTVTNALGGTSQWDRHGWLNITMPKLATGKPATGETSN